MTTTTDGRTNERKTVDDGDVSRSVSMILENVELTVYVSVKHGFSSMVDLETVFVFVVAASAAIVAKGLFFALCVSSAFIAEGFKRKRLIQRPLS